MKGLFALLTLLCASACTSSVSSDRMDQEMAMLGIILDREGQAEALAYWRSLRRVDEGRTMESSLLMLDTYVSRDLGETISEEIEWASYAEEAAEYFGERPSPFRSYMLTGLWGAAGNEPKAAAAFQVACKGGKRTCHQDFLDYLSGRLDSGVGSTGISKLEHLLVAYIVNDRVDEDWPKLELIAAATFFDAELGRVKRDQLVATGLNSQTAHQAFCRGIWMEANEIGEQDHLASEYDSCRLTHGR